MRPLMKTGWPTAWAPILSPVAARKFFKTIEARFLAADEDVRIAALGRAEIDEFVDIVLRSGEGPRIGPATRPAPTAPIDRPSGLAVE